jgi:uncharacterized protein (DUF1684 family)
MTSTLTKEQWLAAWEDWHAAREKAVLAPHGIAANTGTTWLSDDPQIIAGLPGEWAVRDGRAVNEQHNLALAPGEEHHSGAKLLKVIAPRPGTIAVRVFDPAAPTRVDVAGIEAFAPDPAWVLQGRFEPAEPASTIAIQHFDGVTTDDRLSGSVYVNIAGQQLRLAAWPSAETGILELTFADATNGVSTKQFRFLQFAASDAAGVVELDFNRAFLPPCAFGAGYLCPIPPAQNRLPFAVDAGERSPLRLDQPG